MHSMPNPNLSANHLKSVPRNTHEEFRLHLVHPRTPRSSLVKNILHVLANNWWVFADVSYHQFQPSLK